MAEREGIAATWRDAHGSYSRPRPVAIRPHWLCNYGYFKRSARLHESSRRILECNHISWVSPLGRALMKSAAGDSVVLQLRGGTERLTVLEVCYQRISVEPFREPTGSEASPKGPP